MERLIVSIKRKVLSQVTDKTVCKRRHIYMFLFWTLDQSMYIEIKGIHINSKCNFGSKDTEKYQRFEGILK